VRFLIIHSDFINVSPEGWQSALYPTTDVERVHALMSNAYQALRESGCTFEVALKLFVASARRLPDPSGVLSVVLRLTNPGEASSNRHVSQPPPSRTVIGSIPPSAPPASFKPTRLFELDSPDIDVCSFCGFNHLRNPKEADTAHSEQYQALQDEASAARDRHDAMRLAARLAGAAVEASASATNATSDTIRMHAPAFNPEGKR
jgi:hypothetical protein